jgi:hypothetical protein
MLTAAFVAWAVWRRFSQRTWFPARILTAAVLIGIIGLSVSNVAIAADTHPPNSQQEHIATRLARQLERHLVGRPGVVEVTANGFGAGLLMNGIMLDLERHRIAVAVPDGLDNRLRFGAHRMLTRQPIREEVRVVEDHDIDKMAANRCAREIAYWGHSSRQARARAQARYQRIERAVAARTLTPAAALRRIAPFTSDLSAVAVYRIPLTRSARSHPSRDASHGTC